jgi:hypothetical protein
MTGGPAGLVMLLGRLFVLVLASERSRLPHRQGLQFLDPGQQLLYPPLQLGVLLLELDNACISWIGFHAPRSPGATVKRSLTVHCLPSHA